MFRIIKTASDLQNADRKHFILENARFYKISKKIAWRAIPCAGLSDLADGILRVSFAEEKRNTPDSRKRNDRVHDAAEDRILSAKKPCDDIKPKKTDTAPVETADNGKNECNSVEHNEKTFLSLLSLT